MGKASTSDNIESVQLLRGIAAFMVLLVHSVTTGSYFPDTNAIYTVCHNGWMGVNIFFIISGFIIPFSMYKKDYRLSDFGQFFAKRLVRIEPPYIVSIVVVLFFLYLNTVTPWYKGPAFSIDWPNVLGHLGYLNAFYRPPNWLNWAYWTLAVEFQYYIIIALFYPLIVHKNRTILFATFLLLMACTFIQFSFTMPFTPFSSVSGYIDSNGLYQGGSDSSTQILPFIPFFLAGIAYFLFRVREVTVTQFSFLIGISLVMIYYRHGLPLFVVSIATILCMHYVKQVPKAFMWLGTISYSLYLTHDILVSRFQAILERYLHINVIIVWVISLVACLLAAYIYFLLIEKPFLNISKKIGYKHRGNTIPAEPEIVQGEKNVVG